MIIIVSHNPSLGLPGADPVTVSRTLLNRLALPQVAITLEAADIPTASITSAKIANDAVITAKILDAAVTSAKIANDAVITAKILDANIITSKIADAAIITAKIANDAVITAKILDANVTSVKIANDAVITAKILDSAVTTAKIAPNAVTLDKLPASGIPPAKVSGVYDSGWMASGLVAADAVKTYPHGLADYPGEVQVWFRWTSAAPANYAANEAIALQSFARSSTSPIGLSANTTSVILNLKNSAGSLTSGITIIDKTSWAWTATDLTTAQIRIVARLTAQTGI